MSDHVANGGSVADRISEILKFDSERADDAAERLEALGIHSAADSLDRLHLPEICSIGLTELEAIKLRARWIPDAGKNKMTNSQEEHIRVLEECDLSTALKVDQELINQLKQKHVMTDEEIGKIERAPRNDVKVHELVTALQKEGDKYQRFQSCLAKQPHVFTILKEKESSIKISRGEEDKQRSLYVLLKKIDDLSKAKEEKSEQVNRLEQDKSSLGTRINKLEGELQWRIDELEDLEKRYNVALMAEVKSGTLEQLQRLLDPRRDINKYSDEDGMTALIWAASIGSVEKVCFLLEVKADHALKDKDGNAALYYAAKEGQIESMKELLKAGADPNIQNSARETPLFAAVGKRQNHAIELLLDNNAKVDIRNKNECTPLFLAARIGDSTTAIKHLLKHGADIDAERDDGSTPLYIAADLKENELVQLLLEKGADASKAGRDGTTPLHIAAERGSLEICEMLLAQQDADVNVTKKNGATPLHCAAAGNHCAIIELLLDNGATIEAKKKDGGTALFSAAYKGCTDAVICLLLKGAFVNQQKLDGETALLRAIANKEYEVVKVLLERGKAQTDLAYGNGDTPLHVAAEKGRRDIVQLLIDNQVAFTRNKEGKTPIDVSSDSEITHMLEAYEKQIKWRNKRTMSDGSVPPLRHGVAGSDRRSRGISGSDDSCTERE